MADEAKVYEKIHSCRAVDKGPTQCEWEYPDGSAFVPCILTPKHMGPHVDASGREWMAVRTPRGGA